MEAPQFLEGVVYQDSLDDYIWAISGVINGERQYLAVSTQTYKTAKLATDALEAVRDAMAEGEVPLTGYGKNDTVNIREAWKPLELGESKEGLHKSYDKAKVAQFVLASIGINVPQQVAHTVLVALREIDSGGHKNITYDTVRGIVNRVDGFYVHRKHQKG